MSRTDFEEPSNPNTFFVFHFKNLKNLSNELLREPEDSISAQNRALLSEPSAKYGKYGFYLVILEGINPHNYVTTKKNLRSALSFLVRIQRIEKSLRYCLRGTQEIFENSLHQRHYSYAEEHICKCRRRPQFRYFSRQTFAWIKPLR